ncbi:Uncharacterised protein [Bordetella pertussis]|nr:Uncharacterised protein [Bordetella pertussis]CFO07714.1 Uncharacterised protein [Bordetella pertussis]CFP49801.1 Uncharacterised protein [Bordetella pertussis]CFU55599.1 Uncharacterised protein [Bordetella pertussis]CFW65959.1 Uncharacterised protein [Bordetella pertussis]
MLALAGSLPLLRTHSLCWPLASCMTTSLSLSPRSAKTFMRNSPEPASVLTVRTLNRPASAGCWKSTLPSLASRSAPTFELSVMTQVALSMDSESTARVAPVHRAWLASATSSGPIDVPGMEGSSVATMSPCASAPPVSVSFTGSGRTRYSSAFPWACAPACKVIDRGAA